jgi:hypothetical protein
MIYTAHRFDSQEEYALARAVAAPQSEDVIGTAFTPGETVESEAGESEDGAVTVLALPAALPGWHVNAAWDVATPDDVPSAWQASLIPNTEAPRWWAGVPREVEVPPLDLEALVSAVSALVDSVARSMGYASAATCAGYVADPNPQWAAEALAFVAWRSAVWSTVYSMDPADPPASLAAAMALLPPFVRPVVEPAP